MGRYQGTSPFQEISLVWSNDNGILINGKGMAGIIEKPDFTFDYDALLCEPTNCHYILEDRDYALDEGMIQQVTEYIETFAIHGLDQYNHYIGAAKAGDFVSEAVSAPPAMVNGEYWTYDKKKKEWYDDRTEEQRLSGRKESMILECFAYMNEQKENDYVPVETMSGTHNYGLDADTQSNIEKTLFGVILNVTPNPRYWTPKSYIGVISVTHEDIGNIAKNIGNKHDEWVRSYLTHKFSILACDEEQLDAYDYTASGWPAIGAPPEE